MLHVGPVPEQRSGPDAGVVAHNDVVARVHALAHLDAGHHPAPVAEVHAGGEQAPLFDACSGPKPHTLLEQSVRTHMHVGAKQHAAADRGCLMHEGCRVNVVAGGHP